MDVRVSRVILAGGTGFIGKQLKQTLTKAGYQVEIMSRHGGEIKWDGKTLGPWVEKLEGAEAIINLSGKSVSVKWTEENKKEILESRIDSTTAIAQAIKACKNGPKTWINASAVGYYGSRGDETLTEASQPGTDFLAHTCQKWENAFFAPELPEVRRACIRIGVVLGNGGGAFEPMLKATQFFVGGTLGDGKQWVPWIHLDDICNLFLWCLKSSAEGPYNGSAPAPVTNEELMRTLRKVVGRPWSPPAPAFMLKLASKVMEPNPALALMSERAIPERAQAQGFIPTWTNLEAAIKNLAS